MSKRFPCFLFTNENVAYSGNTATITATNEDTENYAVAANMLAGMYPINGKLGVSYENYQPKAKYIKLSFDQTISNSSMWVEYATYYSGAKQALQMWNNGGNLVVGIKGGDNVTCNGNNGKPSATMTGTNHIDWILEPDYGVNMNEYVFVNGTLAGKGSYGGEYAIRLNDIILSTKNAAGTVTIDNWSMTVYNGAATLTDMMGLYFDEPLDSTYDADGDTITIPNNKIMDIGDSLNFVNGNINTGNGYIKAGDKKITGSNIHFGTDGKIRLADGETAKSEIENEDGETTTQGFLFGAQNPDDIVTLTFEVSGEYNDEDFTGRTFNKQFDFSDYEIGGLANFAFTVLNVPKPLSISVQSN